MKNILSPPLGLAILIAFATFSQSVNGQISTPERFVQIRSLDFTDSVLELHNFGELTESLAGWRFCSHDENQVRQYTSASGLNPFSLGPGESLFIHMNNDSNPLDPSSVNRTTLGGSFALPFDTTGAYSVGIYWQTPFGTGSNLADHVQLSVDGLDDTSADDRSDEAQSGGVWANQSEWVNVQTDTEAIDLLPASSANELHSPADYEVTNPTKVIPGDLNCDGAVNLLDVEPFVAAISSGQFNAKADINLDGLVNLIDVEPFVQLLSGGN